MMNSHDLKSMSADELWALHERVTSILAREIAAEKARLEQRLLQLGRGAKSDQHVSRARRPYPKVVPKFRNPKRPSETWAGRWLTAQLRFGKKLDDFRIESSIQARRHGRTG